MNSEKVRQLLQDHVPAASVDYCYQLWAASQFDFKLRKARLSKVGDFTFRPGQRQQITINADLQAYLFLTTYIHEVAHLLVHERHGHRILAHGREWKRIFQELMAPLLNPVVFPLPLMHGLKKHLVNPKASSFSDHALMALFRMYNEKQAKAIVLSDLPEGSIFGLNGRWFKKGKLRRTRVLCQEMGTKRQYLVPMGAEVNDAQLPLL